MASGKARDELIQRVVGSLDRIYRGTGYQVSEEWLHIPLTMPQVRVLLVLQAEQRMRMSTLASALGITFSGATGLVDRLVERELVERQADPEDRRTVVCCLTHQGQELAERLLQTRHLRWEERLRPLAKKELEQVAAAMELIVNAAQRVLPETDQSS